MMRITTSSGALMFGTSGLPERERVERRLELLDRLRVDARAEVLVAAVGCHEHHVALVELGCHARRDVGHGARRYADEHALLVEEPLGPQHRVAVGDEDLPV